MTMLRMAALCLALALPVAVAAPPIARFETVLGRFDVLLEPSSAPRSVSNFVTYANRGDYDSTIIHRSTTYNPLNIQIVQGGGFRLVTNTITPVDTDPPIPLEANLLNLRGTIAMARTAEPDSATSQWYFNVTDNPALNSNYAVFGRVLGAGQSVVDAMGNLGVYDASAQLGPVFAELPLVSGQYLVLIDSVRVEPFAITNITRSGSGVELRWTPLSTNTPVKVQRTAVLDAPWTVISSNNTDGTFTDTNAPSAGAFYRVTTE